MILVVDIGNTNMKFGFYDGDRFTSYERLSTNLSKTEIEFAMDLSYICQASGVDPADIEGSIIASVVPPLNFPVSKAIKKVTGKKPLIVGPGLKTGLKIKINDPATLGADMVVAAVGAIERYGTTLIIIDLGTATTYSYVNEKGDFCGAVIMPGVVTGSESLSSKASLLPRVDFNPPKHVIMKDTIGSMQSGIIYGEAARIDGMIAKIRAEMKNEAKVIMTGGLAPVILPYCENEITLDNELDLEGLKIIYDRNKKG